MTNSTITHIALKTGSNLIHGVGNCAENAIEDAALGLAEGDEGEFTAFPISDRMSACFSFDYNPTEAEILIVGGEPVAELRAASEIAYYAENIGPKAAAITHIAVAANLDGGVEQIQETGSSAEAAIAAAAKATGLPEAEFKAKPVSPRMAAVLASGQVPDSWWEMDGVVDVFLS